MKQKGKRTRIVMIGGGGPRLLRKWADWVIRKMETVGYADGEDKDRCGWRGVVDDGVPARAGIGEGGR
ncbi:hypothetical protein TSUD_368190 [Trifolium subterraneum]|uniref:Uncharacterized protein n=1 Tax=Trifolium subterraneum TaxID=3900 RepID=A0A2Z6LI74_TRISU|nr:hypothetical protein TSUD_368190 [Trifolium subterraneum]